MTVIVWDGRTLAADKLCADNWTKRRVTKIRRVGADFLMGAAGDSDRCRALIAWFSNGADPTLFPSHLQADSTEAQLMVIDRDGTAALYAREPFPIVLDAGFQAIGSGAEAALAAMHCGRTAVEAVEIASLVCRGVGLGIDSLEFA